MKLLAEYKEQQHILRIHEVRLGRWYIFPVLLVILMLAAILALTLEATL